MGLSSENRVLEYKQLTQSLRAKHERSGPGNEFLLLHLSCLSLPHTPGEMKNVPDVSVAVSDVRTGSVVLRLGYEVIAYPTGGKWLEARLTRLKQQKYDGAVWYVFPECLKPWDLNLLWGAKQEFYVAILDRTESRISHWADGFYDDRFPLRKEEPRQRRGQGRGRSSASGDDELEWDRMWRE